MLLFHSAFSKYCCHVAIQHLSASGVGCTRIPKNCNACIIIICVKKDTVICGTLGCRSSQCLGSLCCVLGLLKHYTSFQLHCRCTCRYLVNIILCANPATDFHPISSIIVKPFPLQGQISNFLCTPVKQNDFHPIHSITTQLEVYECH